MINYNNRPIFALVDANNFFVSCERLFNPSLRERPVVVLSNNDGCIISRSEEAKTLGIPMGAPLFMYKDIIEENNVAVFSSNYQLYGDISQRIMEFLRSLVPDIEIYSIDEAFLRLDKLAGIGDILTYAEYVRKSVEQGIGIPLSMGIGPTKTLAKVASSAAKKRKRNKVFDLREELVQEEVLKEMPVEKIWGAGRRWQKTLNMLGIITALDLRQSNPKMIRKKLGVIGERMVLELQGTSCLDLEDLQPRKNITSSRSFGRGVSALVELEEAVAHYTAKAAVRLRKQGSKAQRIYIFLQTRSFEERAYSIVKNFLLPTNDSRKLIATAKEALREIYKPGYLYRKVGVTLLDLTPEDNGQRSFFNSVYTDEKSKRLMVTLDQINRSLGREAVFIASQGIHKRWQMNSGMRSKLFTTSLAELCVVS